MKKIAIIKTKDIYYNYGDDHHKIIDSITDWEEVSDEDYAELYKASSRLNFAILEQPTNLPEFIGKTIEDYKTLIKDDAKRAEKYKKEQEEKAYQKKLKKELKAKEKKRDLLERLKKELGDN